MAFIDLHTHSNLSDGTLSVSELCYTYKNVGVQMVSLTDHDCIDGLSQARETYTKQNILFVNGVEITTREYEHLHFLGYNFDPENQKLKEFLVENLAKRTERVDIAIKKLQEQGVNLEKEDVYKLVKKVPTRAHIADALKNKGFASSRSEAFRKFLVKGLPAYVDPVGCTAKEAIEIIKQAGGKCFIAHPGLVVDSWCFKQWANWGLDGIEIYYPVHHGSMRDRLSQIAKHYKLLASGGSDFHGKTSGRNHTIGMEVPEEVFEKLKEVFF